MEAANPQADDRDEGRSQVDAMGQDKHRQIVGQTYGPTRARQFTYYGIFIAFVVLAYIGFRIAVSELDKAPEKDPASAPWAKESAQGNTLDQFAPKKSTVRGGAVRFQ